MEREKRISGICERKKYIGYLIRQAKLTTYAKTAVQRGIREEAVFQYCGKQDENLSRGTVMIGGAALQLYFA